MSTLFVLPMLIFRPQMDKGGVYDRITMIVTTQSWSWVDYHDVVSVLSLRCDRMVRHT